MELPNRIDPCPIVEALVEVQFNAIVPDEAVFGIVFSTIREDYPIVNSLPILQLPEVIRRSDESLKFKPHYRLENDRYLVQVGPHVLSLSAKEPYQGWHEFSRQALVLLRRLRDLNIVSNVSRAAVRYINFFPDGNIYNKLTLTIQHRGEPFRAEDTYLKAKVKSGEFTSILQIIEGATLVRDNVPVSGSIIDIDTYTVSTGREFPSRAETVLEDAHRIEKTLFFSLLNPEFLATLNPE